MKQRLLVPILIAVALWFLMFSPWTAPWLNFWWAMTASALILTATALCFTRHLHHIALGDWRTHLANLGLAVLIAAVLWVVFYVGDKVSSLLFAFARPQVNLIYSMKSGLSPHVIALLLLCIIGPAEEIFWRGYVQRTLSRNGHPTRAFMLTTAIYTLVHLPSANFMLIMAALTCGLAWGGLYRLMPHRLPAIILSHALWDAAAFVWFPF